MKEKDQNIKVKVKEVKKKRSLFPLNLKRKKTKNKNRTNSGVSKAVIEGKREKEEESKKKKTSQNRELAIVSYIFLAMFVMLIGYYVYFNTVLAGDILTSPYNTRQDLFANTIIRGDIVSADGNVLATTVVSDDGTETRTYPYANVFAHVIGYASDTLGKTGIESLANSQLLTSNSFFMEKLMNDFAGEKDDGDTVVTTLNTKLQKAAYQALGDYEGAVVVLEPSTGKILAMVSKYDYDPNQIQSNWDTLITDEERSPLYNRATQGLYPPGSTFKLVTALAYMRSGADYENYSYTCTGTITVEGVTIRCSHGTAHGTVDFKSSMANSCNTSFVNMALEMNNKTFIETSESLLFNKELPSPFNYSKSTFSLESGSSYGEVMQTAIGQGNTRVTPLHMALIVSAIANEGELMEPYLIDRIENAAGDEVNQYKSSSYGKLMNKEEAALLSEYMEAVILTGTGSGLSGQSYTVAGKTGSAEYSDETSDTHSWFIGFSNVDNPDIVVSVIAAGAGSGSETAVPIAKQIFDAYYNQ